MGSSNQGSQRIGYKFSTPLQADYLNTFIAGFSSPGLLTRPLIIPQTTSYGADITIKPFSILIPPEDTISNTLTDENNEIIYQKMVKITTTTDIKLTINEDIIALGFQYSFTSSDGSLQSQWYGEVVPLDPGDFVDNGENEPFKGIIIATCQSYNPPDSPICYSVKTNGADISDFLLMKEGWNPNKWLSVISPWRIYSEEHPRYNRLEVRTHNDSYKGYINGNSGLNLHQNLTYNLPADVEYGTRGKMPANYNAFKLQSAGFSIAETSDTLPVEKTSGGIFAMVDASSTNQLINATAFTNNLKIKPVEQEDINIYYDTNTLFIR